jgi:hypothetical protein
MGSIGTACMQLFSQARRAVALAASKTSSAASTTVPRTTKAGHAASQKKIEDYLMTLNGEQGEAVLCRNSAVRVKAGPGRCIRGRL